MASCLLCNQEMTTALSCTVDALHRNGVRVELPADAPLDAEWPGLARECPGRSMDADAIRAAAVLDANGLKQFASIGEVITDDNQLLSYGSARDTALEDFRQRAEENLARINRLR